MFEDEARFGRLMEPRACWAPYPMRPVISKGLSGNISTPIRQPALLTDVSILRFNHFSILKTSIIFSNISLRSIAMKMWYWFGMVPARILEMMLKYRATFIQYSCLLEALALILRKRFGVNFGKSFFIISHSTAYQAYLITCHLPCVCLKTKKQSLKNSWGLIGLITSS